MDRMPFLKITESSMKKGMVILFALIVVLGCTSDHKKSPEAIMKFKAGESVFVCGCPMMCCNSISRNPNGRCLCNRPLRQGIVSRIQDGKVYVNVSGREKQFFITSR